eukprot:7479322-Pyramimonas_sp.AAC.1
MYLFKRSHSNASLDLAERVSSLLTTALHVPTPAIAAYSVWIVGIYILRKLHAFASAALQKALEVHAID